MAALNIAFRADAASHIGTGHFMRCLTLAEGLKQRGASIRFVCRMLPEHFCHMLAAKHIAFVLLPNAEAEAKSDGLAHSTWLGASQEQDAQASIAALADINWDWLVVDHYALDARWESALRGAARKIMVIDDIADRQHDCDVLLDQNFYADMHTRYAEKVPAYCQQLIGPRYALLRDEFRRLHEQLTPRSGAVNKILVFFGGMDADNHTALAIEALSTLAVKAQVDVVIGARHPNKAEIEAACTARGYACHVQTERMAELMAAADFSVGAGGTAIWERCCLGLPALSICIAENQRMQIADAASAGLLYAPVMQEGLAENIALHVKALLQNPALLHLISAAGMKCVDGKGLSRIADAMGIYGVEIRKASVEDSHYLYIWRNHPTIRAASRNTAPIVLEDHEKWFAAVMADKDKELLVACIGDEPLGVVRFDIQGDIAEVSIYLVPERAGNGDGRRLLLSAERWLQGNRRHVRSVRAVVLGNNASSRSLFAGAGYSEQTIYYQKDL